MMKFIIIFIGSYIALKRIPTIVITFIMDEWKFWCSQRVVQRFHFYLIVLTYLHLIVTFIIVSYVSRFTSVHVKTAWAWNKKGLKNFFIQCCWPTANFLLLIVNASFRSKPFASDPSLSMWYCGLSNLLAYLTIFAFWDTIFVTTHFSDMSHV